MTESLLDPWIAVAVGVTIAVMLVVLEWLKRRCWHEDDEQGEPKPIYRRNYMGFGKENPIGFSHLLKCKKCGRLKSFRRWAVSDHYGL